MNDRELDGRFEELAKLNDALAARVAALEEWRVIHDADEAEREGAFDEEKPAHLSNEYGTYTQPAAPPPSVAEPAEQAGLVDRMAFALRNWTKSFVTVEGMKSLVDEYDAARTGPRLYDEATLRAIARLMTAGGLSYSTLMHCIGQPLPQEAQARFTESGRHPPPGSPGEDDLRQTKEGGK